ncbi:hypothetical protein JKP88DRAFT_286666 [Tribonema minus]|uniref:Macro domain-containing protein n=2 Tax=Tribonema minus TaxID=303371 RepID=A0A835Z9F0_9STRA|nr:hypothetical protein JKP88DRAFT_286666 [Tribonema minus]
MKRDDSGSRPYDSCTNGTKAQDDVKVPVWCLTFASSPTPAATALAAYRDVLADHIPSEFVHGTIVDNTDGCDIFVSASNSRLCFDGGSDVDYITAFGDPHDVMCADVRRFMDLNPGIFRSDVTHLPVGAAMAHTFGDRTLIAAPTMILPLPVPDTDNACVAFKMTLELLERIPHDRMLVPGLCTGIGRMDAHESARQILEAWRAHVDGERRDIISDGHIVYDPDAMMRQPPVYMNTLYTTPATTIVVDTFPHGPSGGSIWS